MKHNFFYLPLFLFGAAVAVAHGGNDKAPFLVIAAALFSLAAGLWYVVKSFAAARRKNMQKALIAVLPFVITAAIMLAARMHLLDPLPLLGFR
ncbi:MAG: hypothetical protein PSY14_03015 [bacterium]|nr:hypothetical protein [bacterium]